MESGTGYSKNGTNGRSHALCWRYSCFVTMVDLIRTAHWPRIEESYGEDGYLSAAMGVAFVEGLQKKGLKNGVAACTKHFLGYGGGSSLSWKEIYEEVLLPHEAMIRQAGCKVLMTSYGRFRSEQAVSSDTLLNNITWISWI